MTSSSSNDFRQPSATPTWQTITSLLLFVHLFFVFLALASNYSRSELANSLLSNFGFYTRFFNFDLNYTPYYLTHGTDADVDHRIEVLQKGSVEWIRIPESGLRGHDSYQRYQRYASNWAWQAVNEGQPALFAQAVGTYCSKRLELKPQQVRCRRHFQQSREDVASESPAQRDPDAPSRFSVPYAANTLANRTGSVDVVRTEETGQVAVPVRKSDGAGGPDKNARNR